MPLRPWFLFRYGQLLMLLKRRARALEVFRSVARVDPTHHQAWSCAAMLLAERGEYAQAIEAFERALQANPGLERARRGLEISQTHLEQRQPWKA